MTFAAPTGAPLDWAVASRPIMGEVVSGDLHLVAPFPGGVLVAVIDGLGHGPEAEASARTAVEVLREAPGLPVDTLVTHCDRALRRMRGVVMSVASFDLVSSRMTWIGVGNVEGVLVRSAPVVSGTNRERLLVRGGVVGQTMGMLYPAALPVFVGDTLVFATDGIQSEFVDDLEKGESVAANANRVLVRHSRGKDDALILVARYPGRIL